MYRTQAYLSRLTVETILTVSRAPGNIQRLWGIVCIELSQARPSVATCYSVLDACLGCCTLFLAGWADCMEHYVTPPYIEQN